MIYVWGSRKKRLKKKVNDINGTPFVLSIGKWYPFKIPVFFSRPLRLLRIVKKPITMKLSPPIDFGLKVGKI